MRVLIITAGATGDVLPCTGLAARFEREGHEVTLVSHGAFGPLVRARGLRFRAFGGVLGDEAAEDGHEEYTFGRGARELGANARRTNDLIRNLEAAMEAMALLMEGDGDGESADVALLSTTCTPMGWHAAEAAGIPTLGTFLQPAHPTREWPPAFLSGRRSLGGWGNRAAARATHAAIDAAAAGAARRFRKRHGLPAVGSRALRRRLEDERLPIRYGFSPAVVPRPADWREGIEVTGYWWPERPAGWKPPDRLADFLGAGDPPVLIGFGSTAIDDGHVAEVGEKLRAALRLAGVRAVAQSGRAGLPVGDADGGGDAPEVLEIGEVPHDWLMPRTAAVVHHGGAGTAAAALRAGVPAVTVPAGMDRPFWAERLARLGVSPGWVPIRKLSAERLAELIRAAVADPAYGRRAAEVARTVGAEDGAGRVVEAAEACAESRGAAA